MTNADPQQLRQAIRQQLLCDRLLGVREVPFRLAAPPPPGSSKTAGATATAPVSAATAPVTAESVDKSKRLSVLDDTQVKGCKQCGLSSTRTQTVFGKGDPNARLVFIGEAPGYEEDKTGEPFVGKAGQLLTKMINAMGLSRDQVFICNVLKCRPPSNRDPTADEILSCSPYLRDQLRIIRPEVMVALGAPAAKTLLNTAQSIGKLRGRFHNYELGGPLDNEDTVPLMPTYHPAYLLRSPGEKAKAWEDLKLVMAKLGLVAPKR